MVMKTISIKSVIETECDNTEGTAMALINESISQFLIKYLNIQKRSGSIITNRSE